MGTLRKSGSGKNALYTYEPIGGAKAYDHLPGPLLILLAVQATRLVVDRQTRHPGIRLLWKTALDIARGRRPALTWRADQMPTEEGELTRRLPKAKWGRSGSIQILADGRLPINPAGAIETLHTLVFALSGVCYDRCADRIDHLASSVTRMLGQIAIIVEHDDVKLRRLRDLEIRCLVHAWTNTTDVVPADLVAGLVDGSVKSVDAARERALAWRRGSVFAPLPRWADTPEGKDAAAREIVRQRQLAEVAEAERRRYEALPLEERAREDEARRGYRLMLDGLIRRPVI